MKDVNSARRNTKNYFLKVEPIKNTKEALDIINKASYIGFDEVEFFVSSSQYEKIRQSLVNKGFKVTTGIFKALEHSSFLLYIKWG